MKLTPEEVYDRLVNQDGIMTRHGRITFELGDVSIIVRQRDVVGNILQEWMRGWLDRNGIEYAVSENTQMPPDFFLDPDDRTNQLLEIKAFNYSASPAFDIADFRMYETEVCLKPYMLYVDYLIFGYSMDEETGRVTINNVWLKKVWEMTCCSQQWPLTLQVKGGIVHKIRPVKWYRRNAKVFQSIEHFVSAIEQTVWQNPETRQHPSNHALDSSNWRNTFLDSYRRVYGTDLAIQRWDDVVSVYRG